MSKDREKRDIEWLVNWALEKQGVFGMPGEDVTVGGGGGGRLAMMQQLGTIVQVGQGAGSIRDVHPDAQTIGMELRAMGEISGITDLVDLVLMHGFRGDRPDWGKAGCGRYQLQRRGGKARRRCADKRQARGLLGFEFEFVGYTFEEIEMLMVQYVGWRDTLAVLRARLNAKLVRFEATGPIAPEAPWDAVMHIEGEEPRPVHSVPLVHEEKI